MKISPIQYNISAYQLPSNHKRQASPAFSGYIPVTTRKNSLADMEFDMIAETIRSQNLKNQMDARLAGLKNKFRNLCASDTKISQ